MPTARHTLPSLLLCGALLAGCATPDRDPRLQPGRSNEAEVVSLYVPGDELTAEDSNMAYKEAVCDLDRAVSVFA